MATFDEAFVIVVGSEGGYVDNPNDPGKATNWGISSRSYPDLDIKNLTIDHAKVLYKKDYWDVVRGDELPPPLSLITFDAAVNNGPGRAVRWLQQAVGAAQDGILGPGTLAALCSHPLAEVLAEFQARRTLFMLTLPTAGTFGLGWARRLVHVTLASMAFEAKAQPSPPVITPPPPVTLDPSVTEAIEIAVRKALEDKAFTDALNQRVPL